MRKATILSLLILCAATSAFAQRAPADQIETTAEWRQVIAQIVREHGQQLPSPGQPFHCFLSMTCVHSG